MGAFGRAIADVGKGLMERNARKREMEDLARIKAEEEQAAWERDAPKRELEKQWSEQRMAASKAAAEASRMSAESSRLSAIAGSVKGGERFYGQEAIDEEGRTTFTPQREAITRTPDSIAADARSLASIAAKNASTQASRENTSAYRAEQERSRLEAERRRVDEAAVDSAIQINSRKYRPNEYAARDKSLSDIERARKARVAAIDEQILRLGTPTGLLSTAEEIPSFDSPQAAAEAIRAADPNAKINPEGMAPAGPKAKANMGKSSAWTKAYEEAISVGASEEEAKSLADEVAGS